MKENQSHSLIVSASGLCLMNFASFQRVGLVGIIGCIHNDFFYHNKEKKKYSIY